MTLESDEGLDAGAEATDVSVWVSKRSLPPGFHGGGAEVLHHIGRSGAFWTGPLQALESRPTGASTRSLTRTPHVSSGPRGWKRRDWHLHCAEMKQSTMWRRSLVSFHPLTKNYNSLSLSLYFLPLKLPAFSRLPRTLSPGTARVATRVHGALPDSVVLPAPPRRLSTAPIGAKAKLVD